ncbi:hypothetical protein BGZ58_008571 [Dissophora ornata]|nr:hypothetical protein BGZ58_008571 [Dissophora ornata]
MNIHRLTVRNPNAGKAVLGAFASLAGGESSTYIEMAEKARERAFLRMLEHAAAAGGNAVVGVQFTGQEIVQVHGATATRKYLNPPTALCYILSILTTLLLSYHYIATGVMAYGTAVTLVPIQQSQPPPSPQQPMYSAQQYSQPPASFSQPMSPYSQPTSPYSQPMAQQQFVNAVPAPMQQQQFGSPAPPPKN